MNTALENILNETDLELKYFQPSGSWEPYMYSIFIEGMEKRILLLNNISKKLKFKEDKSNRRLLNHAIILLDRYTNLRKKHYS